MPLRPLLQNNHVQIHTCNIISSKKLYITHARLAKMRYIILLTLRFRHLGTQIYKGAAIEYEEADPQHTGLAPETKLPSEVST